MRKLIKLDRKKVDKLIDAVRQFEIFTEIKYYETAQKMINLLNIDNEFDREVIFNVVWRCAKCKKSNKGIYVALDKLDYSVDLGKEDDEND